MQRLSGKAEAGLVRKEFNTPEELVTGLYVALVEYLEGKELLRFDRSTRHLVWKPRWMISTLDGWLGLSVHSKDQTVPAG